MNPPIPPKTSDRARVAELYRRFGPIIYSRCRRMLRDSAAAEDATQEVFLRVLRHLGSAPHEAAALPWLYRISSNYCLNRLRDEGRKAAALRVEGPELPGEDLERTTLQRDLAWRVVARSPERLRAPALLHYVDGLEQAQVARALGVCRRTVINRLGRFTAGARKLETGGPRLAVG